MVMMLQTATREVAATYTYRWDSDFPVIKEVILGRDDSTWEVTTAFVEEFTDEETGETHYSATLKGYKLTKAGVRSKQQTYPQMIINHEVEQQVLAEHKEVTK